ncbi:MAG: carboxy terminal-processing peptidase [bacterium]
MKRVIKRTTWILAATMLAAVGSLTANIKEVDPGSLNQTREHRQAALIISKVIERYHYSGVELNDEISARILDKYLDALDPTRLFFLRADINEFEQYRDQLDDTIQRGDVEPAFVIFSRFRERANQAVDGALEQLYSGNLDFSKDEKYVYNKEDSVWPSDVTAAGDQWRRRVKNDILVLRLAGKPESEIKPTLRRRYETIKRRTNQFTADEVFELFINAYTLAIEPHTAYMSPQDSEDFDISMRLSLQGIGAVLRSDNEFTVVQSTLAGGPAKGSGQVKAGDRIVGVAQGKQGEMVDVIGWRLKDVVELIRGPKGSVVRLNIVPKSLGQMGSAREVTIVRDEIKLENKAAKAEVLDSVEGLDGMRIGVIDIPAFYRDFKGQSSGKDDFRSTTRDVRKLISDLEKENVDGIVIDLRSNGGGALSEATELTGLFIEKGPVVQVKDTRGEVEVERDIDPAQVYSGPLAVLVDRNSASASEIFAGAIQDYRRGLIIGEPTFGKGTVQSLISLNQFARTDEDLGRLRLTIAQFFRIQGGSTQHRGVVPDIVYPTASISGDYGERAFDNALPWASIEAVDHPLLGVGSVSVLRSKHQQRISRDPGFLFLIDQENEIQEIEDRTSVSLLEETRKAESQAREKRRLDRLNALREHRGLVPLAMLDSNDDEQLDNADEDEEGVERIMLEEAARVLSDFIIQQRPVTAQAS